MKITDRKTIELLLSSNQKYRTIKRIRSLIMYLYNDRAYQKVELFSLLRNADEDHKCLIFSILEEVASSNKFFVVNVIAPMLIKAEIDAQFVEVN